MNNWASSPVGGSNCTSPHHQNQQSSQPQQQQQPLSLSQSSSTQQQHQHQQPLSADASKVQEAIMAMYSQDLTTREHANVFLTNLVDSTESWNIFHELVSSSITTNTTTTNTTNTITVEVQYNAANYLFTKAKSHWQQLDEQGLIELRHSLTNILKATTPPLAKVVYDRIILVISALAIRIKNGISMLIEESIQICGSNSEGIDGQSTDALRIGLGLLKAIPDEIEFADMRSHIRTDLHASMRPHLDIVLQMIQYMLVRRIDVSMEALDVIYAWGSLMNFNLSTLYMNCKDLFDLLVSFLNVLHARSPASQHLSHMNFNVDQRAQVFCKTARALVRILVKHEIPRPPSRDDAIAHLLQGILCAAYGSIIQYMRDNDDVCHSFCDLAEKLGEKEVDYLVTGSEQNLAYIDLLLELTAQPNRKQATIVVDFWLELQEIPLEERHPSLRGDIYLRLLDILVNQCKYPTNFTNWDDCDDEFLDEESLNNFRKGFHGVKEAFENCYLLNRSRYFEHLLQRLEQSNNNNNNTTNVDWTTYEVVLFAISNVNKAVLKEYLLDHKTTTDSQIQQDKILTSQYILNLMKMCFQESAGLSHNSINLNACIDMFGAFASLVMECASGKRTDLVGIESTDALKMIEGMLHFCVEGLKDKITIETSCLSIRNITIAAEKAKSLLLKTNQPGMNLLIKAVETIVNQDKEMVPIDSAKKLVEGSIRSIIDLGMPNSREYFNRFMLPIMNTITNAMHANGTQPGSPQTYTKLMNACQCLELIQQAVLFIDMPVSKIDGSHIGLDFVSSSWPVLEQVLRNAPYPDIAEGVLKVYQSLIKSMKDILYPQLSSLIDILVQVFNTNHYPGVLDCITVVVEYYYNKGTEIQVSLFTPLLSAISTEMYNYLQSNGRSIQSEAHLVKGFYHLLKRYIMFCPGALINSQEFTTTMELAVHCLQQTDIDSVSSVIDFISDLIKLVLKKQEFQGIISNTFLKHGFPILTILFSGISGEAPQIMQPRMIECVMSFINSFGIQEGSQCHQWICQAVSENAKMKTMLDENDRVNMIQIMMDLASTKDRRMKMFLTDVAKICGSQTTKDSLLTYRLNLI